MNNELLLLVKKRTDTIMEQTNSGPQETLKFKINEQMEIFSISRPINLSEERKWLIVAYFLKQTILFLIELMKTTVFQKAYQVVGEFLTN